MTYHTAAAQGAMQATVLTPEERAAAIAHLTERDTFTTRDLAIERAVVSKLRAPVATDWRSMDTAPLDGREVLLQVELRAGMPGRCLVGHYMPGGHCIEDHPPIAQGWYFWDGREFDLASKPTGWLPLPPDDVYSALASAPVAGEAQLSEYRRGVMDAFHLANMANANRQGRTAEETCAHLVRSLADLANGDAAPQASEALPSDYKVSISPDAPSLGIAMHQASEAAHKEAAAIARSFGAPDMADALDPVKDTGQDGEAVRTALHDLVDVLQKRHFGRMPDDVQRAFDTARAALSAQPGAQKKGGSDA